MLTLQQHFARALAPAAPADKLAAVWAVQFDMLREHVAKMHTAHPLQMEAYALKQERTQCASI